MRRVVMDLKPIRSRRLARATNLVLERLENRCVLAGGQLDPTFGLAGLRGVDLGRTLGLPATDDFADAIAVQSDGKTLVAGWIERSSSDGQPIVPLIHSDQSDADFMIARFTEDGLLDTSFGPDGTGIVTTDFGGGLDQATEIVVQSDGKIVVVGTAWIVTDYDFAIARYDSNGILDTSFSQDGKATVHFSGNDLAYGVALQQIGGDERVVVVGTAQNFVTGYDFAVVRFNTNGSTDLGFSSDGGRRTFNLSNVNGNDVAFSAAVQPDNRLVIAGQSQRRSCIVLCFVSDDTAMFRLNTSGTLDTSFGDSGYAWDDVNGGNDGWKDIKVHALPGGDSFIYTAGYGWNGSSRNDDVVLGLYGSNGVRAGSLVTRDFTGAKDSGEALVVQPDGKILVAARGAGPGNSDFAVLRYNNNGTSDSSFGVSGLGMTWLDFGFNDLASDLALGGNGSIVVSGFGQGFLGADIIVARYTNDLPDRYDSQGLGSRSAPIDLGTVQGLVDRPELDQLSVSPPGDEDWIQFRITERGSTGHYVRIDFAHALGDLDLKFYDGRGNLLDVSQGTSDREEISLGNLPPGVYQVAVYGFGGAANPNYKLTINAPAPTAGPDRLDQAAGNNLRSLATPLRLNQGMWQENNLSLHCVLRDATGYCAQPDVDWFQFDLPATGLPRHLLRAESNPVLGDINVVLIGADGIVRGQSAGLSDREQITLEDLPAGTYYVGVYGASGAMNPNYSITIDARAEIPKDDFEDNNSQANATNLRQVVGLRAFGLPDHSLSIHPGDEDWYRFELTARGRAGHSVSIASIHRWGDLDLELYDRDGNPVRDASGQAVVSRGARDLEQISLNGLDPGVYYLRVLGRDGTVANPEYAIAFHAPGPDFAEKHGTATDNNSPDHAFDLREIRGVQTWGMDGNALSIDQASDVDWYRFQITEWAAEGHMAQIHFSHALGDLNLYLYTQSIVGDPSAAPIGRSEAAHDGESISLAGLPAGTYYLKVQGSTGASNPAYNLALAAPAGAGISNVIVNDWAEQHDGQPDNDSRDRSYPIGLIRGPRVYADPHHPLTIHPRSPVTCDSRSPDDDDWYSFTLAEPARLGHFVAIEFNQAEGDLDLEIYEDDASDPLERAGGVGDSHRIPLAGRGPEHVYFVRVTRRACGGTQPYTLTINAPGAAVPDIFDQQGPDTVQLGALNGGMLVTDLSIDVPDDIDTFSFTLARPGTPSDSVVISFDPSLGDLDLTLITPPVPMSRTLTSRGISGVERIPLSGLPAGPYFVLVTPQGGGQSPATNPAYSLSIVAPQLEGDWAEAHESEPDNDSRETAYKLREIDGTQLWNGLSIHTPGDLDWYEFELTRDGVVGNSATIFFDHTLGDLDLILYDAAGNPVPGNDGKPRQSVTAQDFEQISLAGLTRGIYYIQVAGHQLSSDPLNARTNPSYSLIVNGPSYFAGPDWTEGRSESFTALQSVDGLQFWSGLSLHSDSDLDFFTFRTTSTGRDRDAVSILFDHAQGNLDLVLIDPNNQSYRSKTVSNREAISLAGLPAGTYSILIAGKANPAYTLVIHAPEMAKSDWAEQHLGNENNDSLATAYDLSTVGGSTVLPNLSIHCETAGTSVCDQLDRDWFRYDMLAPGLHGHIVRVDSPYQASDLKAVLRDASGHILRNAGLVDDGLEISLEGLAAAGAAGQTLTYYVEITSASRAPIASYTLALVTPQAVDSDWSETFGFGADNNSVAAAVDLRDLGSLPLSSAHSTFRCDDTSDSYSCNQVIANGDSLAQALATALFNAQFQSGFFKNVLGINPNTAISGFGPIQFGQLPYALALLRTQQANIFPGLPFNRQSETGVYATDIGGRTGDLSGILGQAALAGPIHGISHLNGIAGLNFGNFDYYQPQNSRQAILQKLNASMSINDILQQSRATAQQKIAAAGRPGAAFGGLLTSVGVPRSILSQIPGALPPSSPKLPPCASNPTLASIGILPPCPGVSLPTGKSESLLTQLAQRQANKGKGCVMDPKALFPKCMSDSSDQSHPATVLSGLSIAHGDQDWFRFALSQDAALGQSIALQTDQNAGALELTLYALDPLRPHLPLEQQLIEVDQASGASDDQRIILAGLPAGNYFLRVQAQGADPSVANSQYSLVVRIPLPLAADLAEPNDRGPKEPLGPQAHDLGDVEGPHILDGLSIHCRTFEPVQSCSAADTDWFIFNTLAPGDQEHVVRIDFDRRQGDLDLALFDANGDPVLVAGQSVAPSCGAGDREEISLRGVAPGKYYLHISGYRGTSATPAGEGACGNGSLTTTNPQYQLTILAPERPESIEPDRLEPNNSRELRSDAGQPTNLDTMAASHLLALTVHPGDVDYFQFTIPSGIQLEMRHAVSIEFDRSADNPQSDLRLDIVDVSGATVAGLARTSTPRGERLGIAGLSPGRTYFVRVQGQSTSAAKRYALHLDIPTPARTLPDDWTILVYITASDLSDFAFKTINELEIAAAALPSSVHLVAFYDQSSSDPHITPVTNLEQCSTLIGANCRWGDAGWAVIQPDTDSNHIATPFQLLGEKNSGDPATLTDFIQSGLSAAPAAHSALIMWNHGSGVRGFNLDDRGDGNGDRMHAAELAMALRDVQNQLPGGRFDLIAFDECLMAMAEIGFTIHPYATYIVASQDVEVAGGYDYPSALAVFADRPDMVTARQFATNLVSSFQSQYENNPHGADTHSAADASRYPDLAAALNTFTEATRQASSQDMLILRQARAAATAFQNSPDYRDLGQFIDALAKRNADQCMPASGLTASIGQAACALRDNLNRLVIAKTADARRTSGLSIYLPRPGTIIAREYLNPEQRTDLGFREFFQQTGWDQFLLGFVAGQTSNSEPVVDWAESNDTKPYNLHRLAGSGHQFTDLSIHRIGDSDWFRFFTQATGTADDRIRIAVHAPDDVQLVATIAMPGMTWTALAQNGSPAEFSLDGQPAGQYSIFLFSDRVVQSYSIRIDAPGTLVSGFDRFRGNDNASRAHDLGSISSETVFSGLYVQAGSEDWFQFQSPKNPSDDFWSVHVHVRGDMPVTAELHDLSGGTISQSGTGELILPYRSGSGRAYELSIRTESTVPVPYAIGMVGVPRPTLEAVPPTIVPEGGPVRFTPAVVNPTGAPLTFALSGNVPHGASIEPATGAFSWTPSEAQGPGEFNFEITVTAATTPPAGATTPVSITVQERNSAPVLNPIPQRSIPELTEITFAIDGTDADVPANRLIFSASGLPPGANFDPATRVFRWTPTEAQGPGDYELTFYLGDGTASDSAKTIITVEEVNAAPVLTPIADQSVAAETELRLHVAATDADLPANTLTFSLEPGAPSGAAIDAQSALFTWTPALNEIGRTVQVVVRIADSGTPTRWDTMPFSITVTNPPPPTTPTLTAFAPDTGLASDGITNDNTPTVTGTAQPARTVRIFANGVFQTSTQADAGGVWSIELPQLADGVYTITAIARDPAGSESSTSSPLSVTIDTTPPIVAVQLLSDSGLSAADRVTQDGQVSVQPQTANVTVDGQPVAIDAFGRINVQQDGPHRVEAVASDAAGNRAVAAVDFILDTTPPSAALRLVSDTGISATDRLTRDGLVAIELSDGSPVVTLDGRAVSPVAARLITASTPGPHHVQLQATDIAGNVAVSVLDFVLDSQPPRLVSRRTVGASKRVTGLDLTFDEPLDAVSALSVSRYEVRVHERRGRTGKQVPIRSVQFDGDRTVRLVFGSRQKAKKFDVQIVGLMDLAGNNSPG